MLPFQAHYTNRQVHLLGATVVNYSSNKLPLKTYNIERTICDLWN